MLTSASSVHLLLNINVETFDLKPIPEGGMEVPEQPELEQVQVDELARAEGSVFQSRSMTRPSKSVTPPGSAKLTQSLKSRIAEIQAADLSKTRSSSSCTAHFHIYTHGYQGYRPVPTQTEHESKSVNPAWFRKEDYLYASDESTSLLSDYKKT